MSHSAPFATTHLARRKPQPWQPAELDQVRALWPAATKEQILAAFPGRTWNSIQKAAKVNGIRRGNRGSVTHWLASELETLRALYPTRGTAASAAALPRHSLSSIRTRANHLGLQAARFGKPVEGKPPVPAKPDPRPNTAKHRPLPGHGLKPMQVVGSNRGNNSIHTPNANARKAQRMRDEQQRQQQVVAAGRVTADQLRALPANHPARLAYTHAARLGSDAAAKAFYAALNQAA